MKPRFTVIFNHEDPTNPQIFNAEAKYFPDLLYSETGFELEVRSKEYADFDLKTVAAMDHTGFTSAALYVKPYGSVLAATSLTTGAVLGPATDGIIEFDVDKDILSNSLSQYTAENNPMPIVLYFTAETATGKISLETHIRVMDINRAGTEDTTNIAASNLSYSAEQAAKWTGSYWGSPTGVAVALDKLVRLDHTDRGSVLSRLATPPGAPSDGDRHLVIATATGAWTGLEDDLAEWNGALGSWLQHTPREGDEFYDKTLNDRYRFNGSAWAVIAGGGGGGDMLAATYDPNTVAGDAFDMDNMVEGTAKVLTAAERAEIAVNTAKTANATHTGEVTGATALTLDKTAVTNRTEKAVPVAADLIIIADSADSNNLKKVQAGNLPLPNLVQGTLTSSTNATAWDIAVDGKSARMTLDEATTITISNAVNGNEYSLMVEQDGTGTRTIAWAAGIKWQYGGTPDVSTDPGAKDLFLFYADEGNLYGRHFRGYESTNDLGFLFVDGGAFEFVSGAAFDFV